jgi:hypothetical protein
MRFVLRSVCVLAVNGSSTTGGSCSNTTSFLPFCFSGNTIDVVYVYTHREPTGNTPPAGDRVSHARRPSGFGRYTKICRHSRMYYGQRYRTREAERRTPRQLYYSLTQSTHAGVRQKRRERESSSSLARAREYLLF